MALAQECQRSTQATVAKKLGVSPTTVNLALGNTYPSPLDKLEGKVRGALMGVTVTCPVLGSIGRDQCLAAQARPFAATSSIRVRVYHACRAGCAHALPPAPKAKAKTQKGDEA